MEASPPLDRPGSGLAFPRWALQSALLGLALLLLVVVGLRLSGFQPGEPLTAVVSERSLRFADGDDGSVRVTDGTGGELLAEMRGEQGFLRGVLRGLARERRAHALPQDPPFVLSLHRDGRLMLTDPLTSQRIDLVSFGPDNAAVFRRWLPGPPSTPGVPTP